MKIVAIIPARYDSSRFPGKPLALIAGKPMIQQVYEQTAAAPIIRKTVVATDDPRIVAVVQAFGGEAVLTRSDHPSGTDRIAEAARELALEDRDIVVNVQGDEPLVSPPMLQTLVEALKRHELASMSTLAFPTRSALDYRDPNVVKVVMAADGSALYFSRSPLPFFRDWNESAAAAEHPVFHKHLGFYAYRNAFLQAFTQLPPGILENLEKLEQLRALEQGHRIQVALSPHETHGVDIPEDVAKVEKYIRILLHPAIRDRNE